MTAVCLFCNFFCFDDRLFKVGVEWSVEEAQPANDEPLEVTAERVEQGEQVFHINQLLDEIHGL